MTTPYGEGIYYAELSPVAKVEADEFVDRKFHESLTDRAITMTDVILRNNGFEPWAIMFDATNLDSIQVHATGMFMKVPHQVAYPAAKLSRPKYVVVAHDRACVAAITTTTETRLAAMTATQHLQEHYDKLRTDIAARIKNIMVLCDPARRDPEVYRMQREQFIEDTAYEYDANGKCLEEE